MSQILPYETPSTVPFVLMTDSQNAVDVLVGSNEDGLPEWPQFTGDDNPDIMILGAQVMAGTGTPSESLEFFDRYFETLLQE